MQKMDRIYLFLSLFCIVYFLEATGGSYIISAVQNIERQFQIPSSMSGFMISASDIGYIPTVIFIAYFGSRGNRAKWIGSGAVMIAITYLAIASPNFIFPIVAPQLNTTQIQHELDPRRFLLATNSSLEQLLEYPLIQDRIPKRIREKLIERLALEDKQQIIRFLRDSSSNSLMIFNNATYSYYSVDGVILDQVEKMIPSILAGTVPISDLRVKLVKYMSNRRNSTSDIFRIRRSAIAPFAYCGKVVNSLRKVIKRMRCTDQNDNFGPFMILFIALFLLGIGRTMPWSLGVPLLDDNVKRKNLPAYFSGMSFIRVLGPICGFLIGSFCNKLYFTLTPPVGLSPSDPTWIGAWWIGFIIIGVATIFPSLALLFFPTKKENGDNSQQVKCKSKQINLFDKYKETKKDNKTMKERTIEFMKSYKEVLQTKIFIGSVLGRICDILAFKGYIVFLPKYLENHFGIPQYLVHRYMAMFGVFGFALGTVLGGLITRRFRLNGRRAAVFVMVVSTINMIIFFSKSFISCESVVNQVGLNSRDMNHNFTRECNADCGCEGAQLFPVCDVTGYAFFSPCHAGCREVKFKRQKSNDLEFSSCECATDGLVRKEYCQDTCKWPTVFFFTTVLIGALFGGMGVVPGLLILLRSVPPATRSQSLGLQGLLVSLFGTLPSPVLWGFIVDSSCLVWEITCHGEHGSCAIYNPHMLRMRMHLLYTIIRLVSMLTDIYVCYHAKGLNILEEEQDEVIEDVRKGSIRLNPLPAATQ